MYLRDRGMVFIFTIQKKGIVRKWQGTKTRSASECTIGIPFPC
jgi:hypothetical protein